MSHTPGPWRHERGSIRGAEREIALIWVEPGAPDPQAELNAKLIAAAPDMLAVLCTFESWRAGFSRACGGSLDEETAAAFDRVRALVREFDG